MLVVDNLSVDDTVGRAREAGFDVLETAANDGFGAGCNAGLRVLDTEFVLFCNPDVRPSGSALEQLLAALADAPDAAVAGAVLDGDGGPRRFSRISTNVAGFLPTERLARLRGLRGRPAACPGEGHIVADYVVGAFVLCRVEALRRVAGFDEGFFLYFEEEDLSRRLSQRGWQTLLVPAAAVSHEQRGSSERFGAAAMAPFFTHSLYRYYRKYHSRAYAEERSVKRWRIGSARRRSDPDGTPRNVPAPAPNGRCAPRGCPRRGPRQGAPRTPRRCSP
jgi:N-acetylglucosaminyl-diphospho-decaprenol L-rhamnosyltransferase